MCIIFFSPFLLLFQGVSLAKMMEAGDFICTALDRSTNSKVARARGKTLGGSAWWEIIAWCSDFPLKKKKKNAAPAAAAFRFVACNIMSDMVWFVIVYCGLEIRSYKDTRSLFLFIQVGTGGNQFIFFQREMHLVACGIYLAARVCAIYLKPNLNSLVC